MVCKNVINHSVFFGLIFVGIVITGSWKLDIIVSKRLNDSLFVVFIRSKLKSPAIHVFSFSIVSLSINGFMKSSMNKFSSMHGCLYIAPIILFLPSWFIYLYEVGFQFFWFVHINKIFSWLEVYPFLYIDKYSSFKGVSWHSYWLLISINTHVCFGFKVSFLFLFRLCINVEFMLNVIFNWADVKTNDRKV